MLADCAIDCVDFVAFDVSVDDQQQRVGLDRDIDGVFVRRGEEFQPASGIKELLRQPG